MNPNVLVINQDMSFLAILADTLKRCQMAVFIAEDEGGVETVLAGQPVDVVLLDVRHEGPSAMQTLTEIKRTQPEAEIILLSNAASISWSMEGMRHGAFDDITVPFDVDTLIKKIRVAWKQKSAKAKGKKKRSISQIFSDVMMAATFAQAGEFDSATEFLEPRRDETSSKNSPSKETPHE